MSSARRDPSVPTPSPARTAPIPPASDDPRPRTTGGASLLARAFWMMLGNGLLAMLLVRILYQAPWSLTLADAAFWTTVALLLAVRTADARWLGGRTATDEPVTAARLRRYWAALVGGSAAAWGCAQAVQL